MGLGPNVLALYQQLKILGALDHAKNVVELGSQDVWCNDPMLLVGLFRAFGRPVPSAEELGKYYNNNGTGQVSSRRLHEQLGFNYTCVDIDARHDSITLDLNFDPVPAEHRGKYCLVTNHGTTEHILNQLNCFKVIHDLTRPGGLMMHGLPFTVHLEHGFFNYQPNFFTALARYNSYRTLGVWVAVDWTLKSFIPWEPRLLEFLKTDANTTHLLFVLQEKMYDSEFCAPIQGVYEPMIPEESLMRYQLVVDGEQYSGKRFSHLVRPSANRSGAWPAVIAQNVPTPAGLRSYSGWALLEELSWRVRRRLGVAGK